jgi:hypothetical protein
MVFLLTPKTEQICHQPVVRKLSTFDSSGISRLTLSSYNYRKVSVMKELREHIVGERSFRDNTHSEYYPGESRYHSSISLRTFTQILTLDFFYLKLTLRTSSPSPHTSNMDLYQVDGKKAGINEGVQQASMLL